MKKILFFSNNKNKILEVSSLFYKKDIRVQSLNDFKAIKSPSETGATFAENAKIKSLFGLNNFEMNCFADDSGICINAIDFKPGVKSKEFLLSEKNIFDKIISICFKKNNFSAYFQTTICLSLNKKKHLFFTGKISGKISKEIRGSEGFGYDPIFIPNGYDHTFAEMNFKEKNKISHRGIAILKLRKYLSSI